MEQELMFQFLIGNLIIWKNANELQRDIEFQFLIGTVLQKRKIKDR